VLHQAVDDARAATQRAGKAESALHEMEREAERTRRGVELHAARADTERARGVDATQVGEQSRGVSSG
jgi:hypothetical protein